MANTYPVAGYRTAEAARRGFQTFEARFLSQSFRSPSSPSARDLESLLQQAFRPSSPGTPMRVGPGASIVPKVARAATTLGTTALTRHPVFRAAQLAWEVHQAITPDPMTAEQAEDTVLNLNGWEQCYKCSDSLSLQYSTGPDTVRCKNMAGCGGYHPWTGSVGDAIPTNHNTLIYGWPYASTHLRAGAQFWKPYAELPHNGEGPYWETIPAVAPMPVPVPVPMPMPYSLIPYQPQSSTHSSGYGEPPSPPTKFRRHKPVRHRRPGRKEKERKFKLMSGGRLRKLIEAAFEGTEWVADLHDALPDDCKAKGFSTVAEKAAAVMGCFYRLDFCKVVENRVNNHIEDKMIGVLGQFAKKSAIGSGKSYGLSGITKRLGKPYFDENGDLQFDPTLPFSIPKVSLGC